MPAPASSMRSACSSTTTLKPSRASARAAVNPPMPAPPTMTMREDVRFYSERASGDDVVQGALGRTCGVGRQGWIVAIKGGAIGADVLGVLAHVAEHVRMVVRRRGAHTHEFLGADLDHRNAWIVLEMRNDFVGHTVLLAYRRVCRFDFGGTIPATGGDS